VDEVIRKQSEDPVIKKLIEKVKAQQRVDYELRSDGALLKHDRIYVPRNVEVKQVILEKAHSAAYAMHPSSTKMYRMLRKFYWWPGMKREIAEYVVRCLVCQQVKPEMTKADRVIESTPYS